jgi:hypothetical protein
MVKSLYLDGCSYTYGLNLKSEETLTQHFIESGYNVSNQSRPGKSNLAIAIDTFNHAQDCDVVVVGWTFSSRFYLKYLDLHIDLLPPRTQIELPQVIDADEIESSYSDLHKHFYSLHDSDYFDNMSDMLIAQTYCRLLSLGKNIVFFSWEKRKVENLYYPHIHANHRLACGHLNANGTTHLYNKLQGLIDDQR